MGGGIGARLRERAVAWAGLQVGAGGPSAPFPQRRLRWGRCGGHA